MDLSRRKGKDSQGEEVIKPYTPTTLDSDVGYFELVIKMYPQGRMLHHFRELCVGDYLAVKGPKGRFRYQPGQVRAFGMIAGGSGITPMFQVARAILENPKDMTNVHLIYANVTYEDILLKEELDSIVANYPGRFKVHYVLNQISVNLVGAEKFYRNMKSRNILLPFFMHSTNASTNMTDNTDKLFSE
ncbi:hypothetical protein PVK06_040347 [Gossypium arboreum]|uniref:Uncharacterized protein n=1 Tax=Gossypium arboreum TaxID=29729 RepID=A0ABR0N5X9_GOSAR|nr:hypothetical protein PVK06_040347 [Gossypium arboreum]